MVVWAFSSDGFYLYCSSLCGAATGKMPPSSGKSGCTHQRWYSAQLQWVGKYGIYHSRHCATFYEVWSKIQWPMSAQNKTTLFHDHVLWVYMFHRKARDSRVSTQNRNTFLFIHAVVWGTSGRITYARQSPSCELFSAEQLAKQLASWWISNGVFEINKARDKLTKGC